MSRVGSNVAHKPREHDEWDPYVSPYDPYGPGPTVSAYAGDEPLMTDTVSADARSEMLGAVSALGGKADIMI
jgi:hypothetical protein